MRIQSLYWSWFAVEEVLEIPWSLEICKFQTHHLHCLQIAISFRTNPSKSQAAFTFHVQFSAPRAKSPKKFRSLLVTLLPHQHFGNQQSFLTIENWSTKFVKVPYWDPPCSQQKHSKDWHQAPQWWARSSYICRPVRIVWEGEIEQKRKSKTKQHYGMVINQAKRNWSTCYFYCLHIFQRIFGVFSLSKILSCKR